MTRAVVAALIIALLPASAVAQQRQGPPTARSDSEKKNDAQIDQAYRAVIKGSDQIAKPVKVDPWQSLRPADGGDTAKR